MRLKIKPQVCAWETSAGHLHLGGKQRAVCSRAITSPDRSRRRLVLAAAHQGFGFSQHGRPRDLDA
jgi:hypothetical protein